MLTADSRRSHDQVIPTVCGLCPTGCGIRLYVKDGQVVDVLGDEGHPANQGGLCARGSAVIQHFNHPARLRQPAVRHTPDQDFTPCGWSEALDFAAARLKAVIAAHGPAAVGVITADRLDVGSCVGAALFAGSLGARLLSPARPAPDQAAAEVFGPGAQARLTLPADRWPQANCLLLLGGDPAAEYPVAFRHVVAARAAHVPVLAAAPRITATLAHADYAFRIRPGSEAAFLFALVKVVLETAQLEPVGEAQLNGLDAWRAAAAGLRWDEIERLTWLPEAAVRRAGLVWAGHSPGVIVGGGVVSLDMGRAAAGLLAITAAATGEARGGWNWLADPPWPFEVDGAVATPAGELGAVRAVVGTGNFSHQLEALGIGQAEAVIHFGAYPDEAWQRAQVSFPAASWAEAGGLHVGHDRRVQWQRPAVPAPGQTRSASAFWAALAERMGVGKSFEGRAADGTLDTRAWAQALLARTPLLAGLSLPALEVPGGGMWPNQPPPAAEAPPKLGALPSLQTPEPNPSHPMLLCRDVAAEGDPAWWPWLHGGESTATFELHPAVAAALDIENDNTVLVDDGQRRYQGRARVTQAVPERTLWASAGGPRAAPALIFRREDHVLRSLARLRALFERIERQP